MLLLLWVKYTVVKKIITILSKLLKIKHTFIIVHCVLNLIYGKFSTRIRKNWPIIPTAFTIYKIFSGSYKQKEKFNSNFRNNYNLSLLIPAIKNNVVHYKEHNAEGRTITELNPLYIYRGNKWRPNSISPLKLFI